MTSARAQRVQADGSQDVRRRPPATHEPWPRGISRRASMRISDVLASLQIEFPAVTTSKLRFLEEQGLVEPVRTAAGYRQYSPADIERLRFVLRQQRDRYMPLKVIGERLAALDAGEEDEPAPRARLATRDGVREVAGTRLDDRRARARGRRRGGRSSTSWSTAGVLRPDRVGVVRPVGAGDRGRRGGPRRARHRRASPAAVPHVGGPAGGPRRAGRRAVARSAQRVVAVRARARWRPRWASCARRCTPRSCAPPSPT